MTLKLPAANLTTMDFVGTVCDAQQTRGRIGRRQSDIVGDPGAAESLDRLVDDLARHARDGDLDHGDFRSGALLPTVSIMWAAFRVSSRVLLDEDPRLRDALEGHALFGDGLAERDPMQGPHTHFLQARSARPMSRMQ